MANPRFFVMELQHEPDSLHLHPMNLQVNHEAVLRNEVRLEHPLHLELAAGASGRALRDLIGASLVSIRLVSDRVVDLLQGFTGWATYAVEVRGEAGSTISGYHGLSITGRCGPIDDSRSQPRLSPPPCPGGRWSRKWCGLYFDESTWDGNDFFVPDGTTMIMAVEPVKEVMESEYVSNVGFIPQGDCVNTRIPAEVLGFSPPAGEHHGPR